MKHLIIRTGALGDFILTLPFIKELSRQNNVTLVCQRDYLTLLPETALPIGWISPDKCVSFYAGEIEQHLIPFIKDAIVHIFGKPNTALEHRLLSAGATSLIFHAARPTVPPSAARRIFLEASLEPPANLESTPILARKTNSGADKLWIHAGSGSPSKTVSPEYWVARIRKYYGNALPPIVVSFGECEQEMIPLFRCLLSNIPYQEATNLTLPQLRNRLETEGACFWGADTGVSHLAAALGIPCTVIFKCTSPEIWLPCGNCTPVLYEKNLF